MANEMKSDYFWTFDDEKIFRNQVSFKVDPLDTVVLKIWSTYLEIVFIPKEFRKRHLSCPKKCVCFSIYQAIDAGIKRVKSDINCVSGHSFTFPYECKGDHPGKLQLLPNGEPFCLSCSKTGETYDLPSGYELWQIHKINKADSHITRSVETHSQSENSVNSTSGGKW
jgi:hypothetical protein